MTVGAGQPSARARRPFRVMLLDLDDTLYRNHAVPEQVRRSIEEYMVTKLGIPADEVPKKTSKLYLNYGTTLAGLVAEGHKIDYDDWHKMVHYGVLDYDNMLQPDPALREILCSIDIPKYILTNADRKHAHICLDRLGISDCFQGIFDFERIMDLAEAHGLVSESHLGVVCKPQPKTYQMVLEQLGIQAHDAIFFDDSIRNLQGAHNLGMFTVLVGRDEPAAGADLAIVDMHKLPQAFPELVDQPGFVHDDHQASALPQAIQVLV